MLCAPALVYAAPSIVVMEEVGTQPATSEWWIVGALVVILFFFGTVGAWCWFVCGGHVAACYADYINRVAVAKCSP
jgi:hypothetical protein